ncbi:MAG: LD-carboxypeptidase [Pseudomonadota bacterium]
MDRRQFLAATTMAAGSFALRGVAAPATRIKAPRLRPGDRVGLVSPATAAFSRAPIEIMVEALEHLGFEVVLGEHFYDRLGYFAGEDQARADDINRFFADDSVRMIFARGGWGSARVLPLLDYAQIAAHPKVLLGYSDATALINGVHRKTGLVTFHGPSPLDRFSADHFQRVLMAGEALTMRNPTRVPDDKLVQTEDRIRVLSAGRARGPLVGGNLTVLTAIIGSPYVPDLDGALLFLEDVGEAVYRVDRMLTQLKLAGMLDRIAGFVFGRCTRCGPGTDYGSLTLEEVLERHVRPLGVPAFTGSMIGHIDSQFTLPLGVEAQMDAEAGTIRLVESAVI